METPGYPFFNEYPHWFHPTAPNAQSLASIALASLVIVYTLYKTLEIIGYPVQIWIRHIVHMATSILGLHGASRSGGLLGSLFGLCPGSLLHKGVRGITDALSKGPSEVPPGLGNISNSCYQNSVIQGLASLPSLRDHLSKTTSEHSAPTVDTMNSALCDIIAKLNDPGNMGRHFWIRGKLKSMSIFQQQDAQEYYSKILDALDEEARAASSSSERTFRSSPVATKTTDTPATESNPQVILANGDQEITQPLHLSEQPRVVPNPLDGLLAQRVGCTSCGYSEGLSLIPFNCLTVSLGRDYAYDICHCLDEYTKLEFIEGVECAKCTLLKLKNTLTPLATAKPDSPFAAKLHALQNALNDEDFEDKTLIKTLNVAKKNWVQSTKSKQVVVARAPKSLVLHINRSGFNEYTGMPYKNTAGVSYPKLLDLGNWCLGDTPSGSQHPDRSLEEWPRDPKESMLPDAQSRTTIKSSFQYRLRAAITHYGSHGNGHYVCYRPHPRVIHQSHQGDDDIEEDEDEADNSQDEQWWRFSDDTVHAVPESEAHQENVFMLFYERVDEPAPELPKDTNSEEVSVAIAMHAPLPPLCAAISTPPITVDEAANIPLPDDDLFELSTPQCQPATSSPLDTATPTPLSIQPSSQISSPQRTPPVSQTHLDPSPAFPLPPSLKSNTATNSSPPQTTLASKLKPPPQVSPHLMRTAGSRRSQGDRHSLQLVSAT